MKEATGEVSMTVVTIAAIAVIAAILAVMWNPIMNYINKAWGSAADNIGTVTYVEHTQDYSDNF